MERYSLMKEVVSTTRRAKMTGLEYLTPPLVSTFDYYFLLVVSRFVFILVLASFLPSSRTLLVKSFQSLFPPLSPQTISLSSARRVVLISYNAERGTMDFRHYIIKIELCGVSRRVRKVLEATAHTSTGFLNSGREKDDADFMLRKKGGPGPDGGYERLVC
jgi:ribosome biogenesis protein SSF1/2